MVSEKALEAVARAIYEARFLGKNVMSFDDFRVDHERSLARLNAQAADAIKAYLSALAEEGYVIEQGWGSIETAPVDIPILLGYTQQGDYMPRGMFTGVGTVYINEATGKRRLWVLNAEDNEKVWPSHWRPLPDPPAMLSAKDADGREG